MNHQSQMKYCWLKRVPLGQRKLYLRVRVENMINIGCARFLLEFPLRRVIGTDVESLTVRLWIGIVTLDLKKARERDLKLDSGLGLGKRVICFRNAKCRITFASQVSVVSGGKAKIG